MESNEQTELTRKMGIDSEMESRWQLVEEWGKGIEGLSKKEKELPTLSCANF